MSKICCQIAVKAPNVSNTNRLKPLVEVPEQSRGSSKLLGPPKGDLGGKEMQCRLNWLQCLIHTLHTASVLLIDSKPESKSRNSDLKDRVCMTAKHSPLSPII
jgi:hypothetical protein